ncbi:hypothetical protein [Neptunomonas phycophila]|uniref:hypothetical protein n=1 Tax=Neptunomonas phycophila TaxID=1572645 RepID=UPI0035135E01
MTSNSDTDWSELQKLNTVDVSKTAACWDGRCVVMGRMNKTASGVKATAAELCKQMGILLPPDMREYHLARAS